MVSITKHWKPFQKGAGCMLRLRLPGTSIGANTAQKGIFFQDGTMVAVEAHGVRLR
jgi:hypothetical protein